MKKLVYNVALALCAMVTINSCSLDEYNPMEVTGEETLATFDGWYGMQTQCYNPIYSQLYTVTDFLSVAEVGTDTWLTANNNDNSKELFYYESLTPSKDKAWDKLFMQAYTALGICNTVINRAKSVALNPQLHSRSATYIKRNGLLIRKITIKSSRPFQCAYHPLTP